MKTILVLILVAVSGPVLPAAISSGAGAVVFPHLLKRAAPKPVAPVVSNGVEYTAPVDAMGFVVATDSATRKELWRAQIYKIVRDPNLEGDVQDVFITTLELDRTRLLITDERGRRFALDLKTRDVSPASK